MATDKRTDRPKFATIIAYIAAGLQRPLTDAGTEVYYDLLGHFQPDALELAAKRAVLEHRYATFPPVALLAEFAHEAMHGQVKALTGSEAWGIAMRVIGKFDVDYSIEHKERILAEMPAIVRAAVDMFGFMALYNLPSSAIETARAQFIKVFESVADRERKTGILPAALQQQIAAIGQREVHPAIDASRANVFKAIEG